MTEAQAIDLAKAYAARWGIPWRQVLKTDKERAWWYFFIESYTFHIDTGAGEVVATVHSETATLNRFVYYPRTEKAFLLPLWAAFPTYSSIITSGWRQGCGEEYMHRWHSFYGGLSKDEKAEYRRKFPAPSDEERCWLGFYEFGTDR